MGSRHTVVTRSFRACAIVLLAAGSLTACTGIPGVFVLEKTGAVGAVGPGGKVAFNADTYVAGIWTSKVVPAVEANAIPAGTLLTAITADQKAASTRYGKQAGQGGAYSFMVKGSGIVTQVDTTSAVGRISVVLDGKPDTTVFVAVGPALVGTAIRDSVGFIDFSQFVNQIDYADVSTALNTKVKTDVLKGIDVADLKGKKVSFAGAFSLLDPKQVFITPVQLTVAP